MKYFITLLYRKFVFNRILDIEMKNTSDFIKINLFCKSSYS